MDHKSLNIISNGADWALIDHRPGKPDMVLKDGALEDLKTHALSIVSGIGWEMVPVYVVGADRIWTNINPHS